LAAATIMGRIDSHGTVEPLIAHMGDPDEAVRQAVARSLGEIGAAALGPVLDQLPSADPRVSDSVLLVLQRMSIDPSTPSWSGPAMQTRDAVAAVKMAGLYGREESVATLQQRMHDTSLVINCAAAVRLVR